MLSALVNGVKGGKWYALMDKVFAPKTLAAAWIKGPGQKARRAWRGKASSGSRPGRTTIWPSCRRRCAKGRTNRKPSGGSTSRRAMARRGRWGSPRSRTASSRQAVRLVIEPIFEAGFRGGATASVRERGCHDALREVDRLLGDGYAHVVDADLAGYFDSIPQTGPLMERVEERISDGRILALLRGWLEEGCHAGNGAMDADGGSAARRGEDALNAKHNMAQAYRRRLSLAAGSDRQMDLASPGWSGG